ncbi:MAG: phage tail protein [Verrucomicrobia bacterium]|nr:phage tail protein [Verrucomicrobiota bacterium]
MSNPFLSEIRMFAGDFAPVNWAFCSGQSLPRSQNTNLFSLLGTNFGGNTTSFNLPDLQGRAPMGSGAGPGLTPRAVGDATGSETVSLTTANLPLHTHALQGLQARAALTSPTGAMLAVNPNYQPYAAPSTSVAMSSNAISSAGNGDPHNNLQPYLVLNFIICLSGVFPQRP